MTIYRKAAPADAPAILEFQIAMARETEELDLDREICAAGVQAVFDDPSRGEYYVGEAEGRVICSLLLTYEWSDWRNGVIWWIQSVYVAPEARGAGAYKGLYRHIQDAAAADDGVRGIRLYVDRRNAGAQRVYARLGMNGEHYQVFEWMKQS
ncbi:MAG: N-acetyltransferase family protein [Blastocatellia bacterium]